MKAVLVLENGAVFEGVSIGASGEKIGELILNTAVVGYQEIITDPANAGKIVVFSYPLIGNYGVAKKFYESKTAWPAAVVTKEISRIYSNWQAKNSFNDFVKKERLLALSEIDTRTLAVNIRDNGQMLGIISTKERVSANLLKKLKRHKEAPSPEFIKKISAKKVSKIPGSPSGPRIGILDLGILNSFIKQLQNLGCSITLIPYDADGKTILGLNLNGLVISSGPEDDAAVPEIAKRIKPLIGKIPILGISLGHQILWLALGGRLGKMKLGHHGVNYPVKSPSSYKGLITVQNHSFIIDEGTVEEKNDIQFTLRNVNDNSVEEMESARLKFISAQYYPVSPGFDEVNDVFRRFNSLACQNVKT